VTKHLPIESRAVKHPCGARPGAVVAPGEQPTCLNCRRIALRRAQHVLRLARAPIARAVGG
jgi:hypothetical protein